MVKTEHVRIPGYSGTWSSIRQSIIYSITYYLMESDLFREGIYHNNEWHWQACNDKQGWIESLMEE